MKKYTLFYVEKSEFSTGETKKFVFEKLEDFEQFFVDLLYEFDEFENPVIEFERLVVEVLKNA